MKELLTTSAVALGIISTMVTLIFVIYGQGKAKQREEDKIKQLAEIDVSLKNHITELRAEMKELKDNLIIITQEHMQRISRIEGKLNLSKDIEI